MVDLKSGQRIYGSIIKPNQDGCGCVMIETFCDETMRLSRVLREVCRYHSDTLVDVIGLEQNNITYSPNYDVFNSTWKWGN